MPLNVYGHIAALGVPADEPLLADGEVRYAGQPIALVAADSEALATEAVRRIEIAYEERPTQFDIRKAFDPGAPHIHQWGTHYPHFDGLDRRKVRKGDIGKAFEQADLIVQGAYRPAAIEHVPLETQVCQVVPDRSGRYTIYSATQAMYFSLGVVAAHLQLPLNRFKLVGGTTGGGFGGKVDTATETVTTLLAMKSGRPVRWRWTREEEFLCSSTRAPWHMEIADAVTKDGWILGRKMLTLHDAGAYARFSPYGVTKHAFHHTGAYTIPNIEFDGMVVFTNRVPTTAMRGFGVTSVSFATEVHLERIAQRARDRPARAPAEEREPDRRHVAERRRLHRSVHRRRRPDRGRDGRARAPASYRTMTNAVRDGEMLPGHLVGQLGDPEDH